LIGFLTKRFQQQQDPTTAETPTLKHSDASYRMDANNGGNTRKRRDVNNNRIPATAECHTTA
jgi:hypothetical protein